MKKITDPAEAKRLISSRIKAFAIICIFFTLSGIYFMPKSGRVINVSLPLNAKTYVIAKSLENFQGVEITEKQMTELQLQNSIVYVSADAMKVTVATSINGVNNYYVKIIDNSWWVLYKVAGSSVNGNEVTFQHDLRIFAAVSAYMVVPILLSAVFMLISVFIKLK